METLRSRPTFCLALFTLASLWLGQNASAATRDQVLEWLPPSGSVSGYRVHLGLASASYGQVIDLGAVPTDQDGVGRSTLTLDATRDYFISLSAYNSAGSSPLSNEIRVPASQCDVSACSDGSDCTADNCTASGCTHASLPNGTLCSIGASPGMCVVGACQVASGAAGTPSSGLVAAYGFEEQTGATVADGSGNGNTGALVGGVAWTTSLSGSAVQLDGRTGYVTVPLPGLPAGDFTASAWVNPTSTSAFQAVMEMLDPASRGWEFVIEPGGRLGVWSSGQRRLLTDAALQTNTWTHVAVRRAGATWTVFINGAAQGQTGNDGTVFSFGSCPFSIGVDADSGCTGALNGYFNGRIDEVRVEADALTNAEIQATAGNGSGGSTPNQPPVAVASGSPTSGIAPLTVSFSSSGSRDPEGAGLSYSWSFGDGASSTAPNPTHVYAQAGSYVAKLAVSDGASVAGSNSLTLSIQAAPPPTPPSTTPPSTTPPSTTHPRPPPRASPP